MRDSDEGDDGLHGDGMRRRRICVVTGSRAEYGLLRWVMADLASSPEVTLQLIVTGSHLSDEFGRTEEAIAADGFTPDRRIEIGVTGGTPRSVTESMGRVLLGLAEAMETLRPDVLILLGDRYETWCAAGAATVAGVPIAHIHGGELTAGAIDDAFRHGITKMAHLHFVAAADYARRVAQLGEPAERIHIVGAVGLDSLNRIPLLDRETLSAELAINLANPLLLITYHPVTLRPGSAEDDITEVLAAVDGLTGVERIFTLANADPQGWLINERILDYCATRERAHAFPSLGQQRYLSLMREASAVVGNSSSGLIEAPALGTPTVNIGERQAGRLRAASVVDCDVNRAEISEVLNRLLTCPPPRTPIDAPYGKPGASAAIVAHLLRTPLVGLREKGFVDLR